MHECDQCDTSKAWAARKGRTLGVSLAVRLDELLHRFECRHRYIPGHHRFCLFVDRYAYGVPVSSLHATEPSSQVKEQT